MKVTVIPIDWKSWKEEHRDHKEYKTIKIDQNTEKSPGDLRRLTVIQTSVGSHQQSVKISLRSDMNNYKRMQQACIRLYRLALTGGKSHPLRIKTQKFEHSDEWYMPKSKYVLENEAHTFFAMLRYKFFAKSRSADQNKF